MIRIIIADDHPVVLEGVRRLVSDYPDLTVVAEAQSGDDLLDLEEHSADVLLLDISMPGPPFLEVLRGVRESQPQLRILVLSARPEELYAVRCLRMGAAGYVNKASLGEELVEAIRRVALGGKYVSPSVAETLVDTLQGGGGRPHHEALSDREFQVLRLTALGMPVKRIARELGLSPKTVSTYRRRIRDKLEVESQAGVIRYAVEHGIVDPASVG